MKKLLILILIALLLALVGIVGLKGVQIWNIEILGIQEIQDRSAELDETIQEAGKLAQKDFQEAVQEVKDNSKKLKETKQEYLDMTAVSSESDVQSAAQLETYEIETLWVKLGNHATNEGATMKMDVTKGTNTTQETYNLNFTVNGSYISITDFISDIENDETLGFKIEEFKLVPSNKIIPLFTLPFSDKVLEALYPKTKPASVLFFINSNSFISMIYQKLTLMIRSQHLR